MKTRGARCRSGQQMHARSLEFLYLLYARQPLSRLIQVIFQELPSLVDGDNVMVGGYLGTWWVPGSDLDTRH